MTVDLPEWDHLFYDLGALPDDWGDLGDAFELWDGKRDGKHLPAWSNCEPFDFVPWMGYVEVARIERDPFDVLTTLWGTELVNLYGFDATGRRLSDVKAERGLTRKDLAFWQTVVMEPCIGLARGAVTWNDLDHVRLKRLYLPFGEDGDTCDRVVSITKKL